MCIPFQKAYSKRNFFKAKKTQREIQKLQFQSKDKIKTYRDKKFCDLIQYCYENVPYYTKIMNQLGLRTTDFKTIDDVVKLPLLTKQIITENFNSLISKKAGALNTISTGGTSGKPICVARGKKEEYLIDASNWRMWNFTGYELGKPLALFWGNELELKNEKTIYFKLKNWIENTITFNCFDLTEERIKKFSKKLNKSKPLFIRGYASAIYQYSRYCLTNGIASSFIPNGIILTSEKIYKRRNYAEG